MTAKFYFERILPQVAGLLVAIRSGKDAMMKLDDGDVLRGLPLATKGMPMADVAALVSALEERSDTLGKLGYKCASTSPTGAASSSTGPAPTPTCPLTRTARRPTRC